MLGRNSANNGVVEVFSQTQFVEQVDLATVFTQHKNGDEHGNYLTNARADARYATLTGIQTISGAKTFSNSNTKFGAGGEILSTVSSQLGFYSGYSWNGNALLSNSPSSGFVGINFYQPGIAFCYDSGLVTGTNGIAIATKLLVGSSNVQIPISVPSISPTTGAFVVVGGMGIGGNLNVGGFTSLGDNVAIKVKRLTGISASTQGSLVSVAHGLSGDKIQGFVVKLAYVNFQGIASDFDSGASGMSYDCLHDAVNFVLYNHPTNSANILAKPFSILVFYVA
ncbi:hypothetical protein [Microcoleus sp. CAWBG640]|uniref:hypothetical protein n=1 Tax=Microcoleus sp. CAWBG640 TaxID=2841653 RepID=UPI00312B9A4D